MNLREPQPAGGPGSDAAAKKRAVKVFVWAVVALVLFNLVLFAKFVSGAKNEGAPKSSSASQTSTPTSVPAQP